MEITLLNIFKVFFKIGAILLGGGYVIVPIMKEELCEKRNWIKEEEILDFYCMSQCLSGIIAINMAVFVGSKLKGFKGALTSLFAMALSPVVTVILLAFFIQKIMSFEFIQGIFWGVNISVIILIYLTVKDMWNNSIIDKKTVFWFLFILVLYFLKLSPVFLIILSIITGIAVQFIEDKKNA